MNSHLNSQHADDPVCLIQFTDTHLFAGPETELLGIPTHASFEMVLEHARTHYPQAVAYLITGDISQDYSPASYQRFRSTLDGIATPSYLLPGNHDDPELMDQVFASRAEWLSRTVDCGQWRIVLLDSTVRTKEHGWLDDDELALLDQELDQHRDRFHIVALHHPAVPLGSDWVDRIGLRNADALFKLVDDHHSVRALIWGHAHQEFDHTRNGVRLLGTPSTCFQFMPRQDRFGVDDRHPGYRVLFLGADGALESYVERLTEYPFEVDADSTGY